MNYQQTVEEGKAEFMKAFKCINSSCDQQGSIPHQVSEDEWEAEQCQYCWEIRFPARDSLDTFAASIRKATLGDVRQTLENIKAGNIEDNMLSVGERFAVNRVLEEALDSLQLSPTDV